MLDSENFERDELLKCDDVALVALCDLEFYKGSGNGGQKRNKTSSAVRVRHRDSGLVASDCSEREQLRNRHNALKKLRICIALTYRQKPAPLVRMECALESVDYPLWVAQVLDALAEFNWGCKAAAEFLGFSTTGLLKKIARDATLWQFVNSEREKCGLRPLKRS